jgi:hypothetical protein
MTALMPATTVIHAIGTDGLLVLRVRDGRVRLRGVPGDAVRVGMVDGGPLDGVEVERGSGSLAIRVGPASGLVLGRGGRRGRRGAQDLEIDVPAGAAIVVEGVSADIDTNGMTGDQRYRSAAGDLSIRAARGAITAEAMSGDIDLVATGPATLHLRTVSGDIAVRAGSLVAVRATTTSGDLRIAGRFDGSGPYTVETVAGNALFAPAGDATIDIRTISGDVRCEIPSRMEEGSGRRTVTIGAGGPAVTVRSLSGDLRIVPATGLALDAGRPAVPAADPAAAAWPPPTPMGAPPSPAIAAAYDDARLGVLRALERGDMDVSEARQRLEALDGGVPPDRAIADREDTDA